jgi:HNH endonuclease
MAISDADYKILWGRAGGICSNPDCRADLTVLLKDRQTYNVGEMAHIIARKERGPRGRPGGGADDYSNLILLCPTCHAKIDKAPEGTYTEDLLHKWKAEHEAEIQKVGSAQKFSSVQELKQFVATLLNENHHIWREFGPQSHVAKTDFGSNLHRVWELRKQDCVLPNNRRIVVAVEANLSLLNQEERTAFLEFKSHATAWAINQEGRLDNYPAFPADFAKLFSS